MKLFALQGTYFCQVPMFGVPFLMGYQNQRLILTLIPWPPQAPFLNRHYHDPCFHEYWSIFFIHSASPQREYLWNSQLKNPYYYNFFSIKLIQLPISLSQKKRPTRFTLVIKDIWPTKISNDPFAFFECPKKAQNPNLRKFLVSYIEVIV